MSISGTVVNGAIVPDVALGLPDGMRIRFEIEDDGPEPLTREEHLAALRESIEDMKAGRGMPLDEAMDEICRKYNLIRSNVDAAE